jgi:hypothetical protein
LTPDETDSGAHNCWQEQTYPTSILATLLLPFVWAGHVHSLPHPFVMAICQQFEHVEFVADYHDEIMRLIAEIMRFR